MSIHSGVGCPVVCGVFNAPGGVWRGLRLLPEEGLGPVRHVCVHGLIPLAKKQRLFYLLTRGQLEMAAHLQAKSTSFLSVKNPQRGFF